MTSTWALSQAAARAGELGPVLRAASRDGKMQERADARSQGGEPLWQPLVTLGEAQVRPLHHPGGEVPQPSLGQQVGGHDGVPGLGRNTADRHNFEINVRNVHDYFS